LTERSVRRMRIAILFNQDTDLLDHDPGREAREDVTRVATAFSTALEDSGARVTPIAAGSDLVGFVDKLRRLRPDVVVNLCESLGGDSRGEMAVPTLLEVLGLPYTGSPALALGLALNKDRAKELLRAAGVPVPAAFVVAHPDEVARIDLPFPLIVKPSREDASVGIDSDSVVHNRASLAWAVERVLRTHHQPALVETFVAGRSSGTVTGVRSPSRRSSSAPTTTGARTSSATTPSGSRRASSSRRRWSSRPGSSRSLKRGASRSPPRRSMRSACVTTAASICGSLPRAIPTSST